MCKFFWGLYDTNELQLMGTSTEFNPAVVFPFMVVWGVRRRENLYLKNERKFFFTTTAQMRIELGAIKGAASHSHLDVISSIWRHLGKRSSKQGL